VTPETKANDKQTGQGFVEFALILPVLLLLMFGVIEFGRLLFIYTEVSNAAREAVRYGIVQGTGMDAANYEDCEGIRAAAQGATVLTAIEDDDISISYDNGHEEIYETCPPHSADPGVHFGDRLMVEIIYQVTPLVLFRDAGPFNVRFSTARTIVYEGLPLSGFTGGGATGNPLAFPSTFAFVRDPDCPEDDEDCCRGHFEWDSVSGADGYILNRWQPSESVITDTLVTFHPDPGSPMTVGHAETYFVQAYDATETSGRSNYAAVSCLNRPKLFRYEPDDSCTGQFKWDKVEYAEGYHLYTPDSTFDVDVNDDCGPHGCSYDPGSLTTNGPFTVTAYTSWGDGLSSSIEVPGCTYPLLAPELSWNHDDGDPCVDTAFVWNAVEDALGYRLYEASVGQIGPDIPTTTLTYSQTVANGERYQVVPYNLHGPSGPSNVVFVHGCPGPQDLAFYLHTQWPGPGPSGSECLDHDGYPPLLMNINPQTCRQQVYDYNNGDGAPEGRKVLQDGAAPSAGETDSNKYLAWHTSLESTLTITGPVTLRLWYINLHTAGEVPVDVYLCRYSSTAYDDCEHSEITIVKNKDEWTAATATWSLSPAMTVVPPDELAVYLIHDGGSKSVEQVWFIYDKGQFYLGDGYESRIEFEGEYGP